MSTWAGMTETAVAAPRLEHRDCPVCHTENGATPPLSYSWREWVLRQCRACRFIYLENPPSYEDLAVTFGWETNHGERADRMRAEHPVSSSISRNWATIRRALVKKPDRMALLVREWVPPGQLVEIGCGAADRLVGLAGDYKLCGIEISESLAAVARNHLAPRGGEVLAMPALDGLATMAPGSVSGVLMRSFLEHEAQPSRLLAEVRRVIAPGGAIIIKVPNYACLNRRVMGPRWCGFRFPGHVNYFTPDSLTAMVEAAGFTVARFGLRDRFYLSDNMWMVARAAD
jgi:SAM-dependent methyltransferase